MKIVAKPIKVPDGDYCWNYSGITNICENFDNEGGHGRCTEELGTLWEDKIGVKKCEACKNLKQITT